MKNEFFYENIDRLYAAAKEKYGERAEEALVNAVRKTAGKFKKLGEKAYITALLQELGVGAFYEAEEPAPYDLAEKLERIFTESYAAAQKKSRLFAILGGAAAAVCLAAVVGLLLRPGDTIVTDGATIKGAKAYASGDFVLTNVHTINDYTGFDGDFGVRFSGDANKEQAASTVAPDGTVYLLTVCEAKPEEKINMQGLFKMTEEGWVEICRFEQKVDIDEYVISNDGTKLVTSSVSRGFVFCDAESNPVVFLYDYEDEKLVAYSCDVTTGQTEVVAEVPVTVSIVSGAYANICACADGDRIYFVSASNKDLRVDILVYDMESRQFRTGSEVLLFGRLFLNAVAHRNDCTYLLGFDQGTGMWLLCSVRDAAEDTQELIYEYSIHLGRYKSYTDCASLFVDEEGTAYAFITYKKDPLTASSTRHGLEIVSATGKSLLSKAYSPLHYAEEAKNCGIFMGPDETMYFIECYEASRQITVGTIAEDYEKTSEAAAFQSSIIHSTILRPQFISDPAGKNGVFVDLLGQCEGEKDDRTYSSPVMRFGYMRLRLK